MTLDDIAKDNCTEIFLMDSNTQVLTESNRLGKATLLPISIKAFLDKCAVFAGKMLAILYTRMSQKLCKREGEYLPRQCSSTHLCCNLFRQILGGRTGNIHFANLSSHQTIDEWLP